MKLSLSFRSGRCVRGFWLGLYNSEWSDARKTYCGDDGAPVVSTIQRWWVGGGGSHREWAKVVVDYRIWIVYEMNRQPFVPPKSLYGTLFLGQPSQPSSGQRIEWRSSERQQQVGGVYLLPRGYRYVVVGREELNREWIRSPRKLYKQPPPRKGSKRVRQSKICIAEKP